jgi:hypothetical protein
MYQLAIVADAESMTAELAETFTEIKANMTAGAKVGEAPRYFTLAMKRADESGESGAERQGDVEMGGERQPEGDEAVDAADAVEADESEAVGRMASTGRVKRMRSSPEEEERAEKVARLAVLEAEVAGLKAEAAVLKADLEGLVKKVARAEAGPYYLEDEDYGARYAPSSRP